MSDLRLVMIEWIDSAQPIASWHYLYDLQEPMAVKCRSVGWVVKRADDAVMIAQNIGDWDSGNAQAGGIMTIPARAIVWETLLPTAIHTEHADMYVRSSS